MKPTSLHLMNSVTKTFVGMLVGILAAEGVIELSQTVADIMPEFGASAFRDTTVQHALDMARGQGLRSVEVWFTCSTRLTWRACDSP